MKKYLALRDPNFRRERSAKDYFGIIVPPNNVIKKILSQYAEFEVTGSQVKCLKIINKITDGHDSAILDYFSARNFDLATIHELRRYFVKENRMSEGSFAIYMTYKPYIKRYAQAVYGIVGKPPLDESALINAKNRIEKKPKDKFSWCTDREGILIFSTRLHSIQSCVFSFYGYEEYLNTETFKLIDEYDEEVALKKSGAFWYGLGPYLVKNYFEIDDYLQLELNLVDNTFTAKQISETHFIES